MLSIQKILCPVDFSEASWAALDVAAELAAQFGATVEVLHILPVTPGGPDLAPLAVSSMLPASEERKQEAEEHLREILAQKIDAGPTIGYHIEVRFGEAAEEIVAYARDRADLIVISTHGRTGLKHLLFGSVAEAVVRQATCPVLTVRPGVIQSAENVFQVSEQAAK